MLSVSPETEIALDPYMDLFKAFRQAIYHEAALVVDDAYGPFSDYYFDSHKLSCLDSIMTAEGDYPTELNDRIISGLKKRVLLSSGDLLDKIDEIKGNTIKSVIDSAMNTIYKSRGKAVKNIGWHENWSIEFFPYLARLYPDAKFLVVLRDPRAVICSSLNVSEVAARGQIISYARCLRKYHALAFYFSQLDEFKNRLKVVRFEDVVAQPREACMQLCDFFEMKFHDDMLDTNKFIEPSTGGIYNGFSSFEKSASGFSTSRTNRWTSLLSELQVGLIEFIVGPEMTLWDYNTSLSSLCNFQDELLGIFNEDLNQRASWHVDFAELQKDLGFEFFRQFLLKASNEQILRLDNTEIRKSFLFTKVYKAIKSNFSN